MSYSLQNNIISNDLLKDSLQYSLLSYFQTDNIILNYIYTAFALSLVSQFIQKIDQLPYLIYYYIKLILGKIYYLCIKCFQGKKIDLHIKRILIEKITDERQLNPLYNSVSWYLMNKVELEKEDTLKLIIDKKITGEENIPTLMRRVTQDKLRKFWFNKTKIYYKMSFNRITVDGENGDRRNDNIECWIKTEDQECKLLEQFVKVCMEKYQEYVKNNSQKRFIYQNMNGKWQNVCEQVDRMSDTIVLKNNDKETLMDELTFFLNNKEWYINHGFIYSLGVLLHGSPGTGKTSFIRYISSISNRNTHYLRLNQIKSEDEFNKLIQDVKLTDSVLVMEDIDCAGKIVHSREKTLEKTHNDEPKLYENDKSNNIKIIVEKEDKKPQIIPENITLDVLLNMLDGILTVPGQIIIMTTNHKEILDKALIRPGRIDISLELGKCDNDMLIRLYKKFYKLVKIDDKTVQQINLIEPMKYSPAEVMNIFRRNKNNSEAALKELF